LRLGRPALQNFTPIGKARAEKSLKATVNLVSRPILHDGGIKITLVLKYYTILRSVRTAVN